MNKHPSIGPHEGWKLELMLNGEKPLAYFMSTEPFPAEFDPHIASGRLFRTDIPSAWKTQSGKALVYYFVSHHPDDPNIRKLFCLKRRTGL